MNILWRTLTVCLFIQSQCEVKSTIISIEENNESVLEIRKLTTCNLELCQECDLNNKVCKTCVKNAFIDILEGNCVCKQSYSNKSGVCTSGCAPNCVSCAGSWCTECKEGFFIPIDKPYYGCRTKNCKATNCSYCPNSEVE